MQCELLIPYIPHRRNFDSQTEIEPERYISLLNTNFYETSKEIEDCLNNKSNFTDFNHHSIKMYDYKEKIINYQLTPLDIVITDIDDRIVQEKYLKYLSFMKEMCILTLQFNENIFDDDITEQEIVDGLEELQFWVRDSLVILKDEEYVTNNDILLKVLPERDFKVRFFETIDGDKKIYTEFIIEKCKLIEFYNRGKYSILINKVKQTK